MTRLATTARSGAVDSVAVECCRLIPAANDVTGLR